MEIFIRSIKENDYENIDNLNQIIYTIENQSSHPISKAIDKYLQIDNNILEISNFINHN